MSGAADLYPGIYARRPWDESLAAPLRAFGFAEPRQAWEHLLRLAPQADFQTLFPQFFPRLLDACRHSFQADAALLHFENFSEKIYDKNYLYTLLATESHLLPALAALFSGSESLTATLLADPSHFDWLKNPDTLHKPKSKDALFRDFYAAAAGPAQGKGILTLLRRFKRREYIRIGLRDLLGFADLRENVEDLSNLADVCLQAAYEYAHATLRAKHGAPMHQDARGEWVETEFAVLGMGKLGGRELNYSSDIDLIYIYASSHGETRGGPPGSLALTNHEYFCKLAQLLTSVIHEITADGNVFRVDLNLRPEGPRGEVANSLASCETYYQSWGRTWERQAMLKARVCAGSEKLGKEFLAMMEPFIHRRSLDYAAIDEIKGMKQKIDLDLRRKKDGKDNIKLGAGGIREVEFIVQSHQLLFGGKHPRLRVLGTLNTLERLEETGLLLPEDARQLRAAYIFLRQLENRVQMAYGMQTYSLPQKPRELAILARKMGFTAASEEECIRLLRAATDAHTRYVNAFFSGLFADEERRAAGETVARRWEEERAAAGGVAAALQTAGFPHPDRAAPFLRALREGPAFSHPSEKSLRGFDALLPRILDIAKSMPKPNSAVEGLCRFIEATGARETFFDLFRGNEKFMELLLTLFGSSDLLSQTLTGSPGLMDVLLDTEGVYRFKHPEKLAAELLEKLRACSGLEDKKNLLRRFKRAEELRIGIRLLIRETGLEEALADLSALAEVFLRSALSVAEEETRTDGLAIIGMGKLGGEEINFGSDLDLIFVHPDGPADAAAQYAATAQMVYQLAAAVTAAGCAYKIDTDLRPEGSHGGLALSLSGYKSYFDTRGRVWERQAMTRARHVAGNREAGKRFIDIAHAFAYQPRLEHNDLIDIARSRERMETELAQEGKRGKNVKLGFGGLVDIEFTAQILQLAHGHRYPRLRQTNTLMALAMMGGLGILEQAAVERLRAHYLFLRRVECALRIKDTSTSNHLPENMEARAELARLLGYTAPGGGAAALFLAEYGETTCAVRAFYRKTIDTLLRAAM